MKKTFLKAVIIIMALTIGCLSLTAGADFSRVNTYTDGMFVDVTADQWYAESVKNAYEFGIMNGKGNVFDPDGNLKVSEAITVAARIYETISGKAIPEAKDGEWYQKYIDYAIANGFVSENQFDNYDRLIKRFEMASVLADACGELAVINNVTSIPDVDIGAPYFSKLIKLYNAGILTGSNEYGDFNPNQNLKRSEISAMAVRVADSSLCKQFVPLEEPAVVASTSKDAYAIIETLSGNGRNGIANGWNYDNRFDFSNVAGADKNYIVDSKDTYFMSFIRDFDAENQGTFHLEALISAYSKNGCVYLAFENAREEKLFGIKERDGKWVVFGEEELVSDVDVLSNTITEYAVIMEIDHDNHVLSVSINNEYIGKVSIPQNAMSRLVIGTEKVGTGYVAFSHVRLKKNYDLNERFYVTENQLGEKPIGWNIEGDFVIDKMKAERNTDMYSIKADSKAGSVSKATKTFSPVSGKFSFETFVLLPEKVDGAEVSLMSGSEKVFKFETKNGNIVMGDNVLNDYIANVWQCLHIEADTNTGKAEIKVNGKTRATVDFTAEYFDGVEIFFAPETDAVMWFDDVELYNLFDYDDYPAEPVVAESKDYNVGINVCWLWRDAQSGEGWDAASPFPEIEPYLGYYEDGLRETADWELKYLAEHGVDFMHVCWYSPDSKLANPVKRMGLSYSALHDGYMNAKYSHLVDFCLLWENAYGGTTSFEDFKEYLWNYWVEYYFKDERYARLDNKAVLSIYQSKNMYSTFGGEEGTKAAFEFMEEELKKLGYDGIILLFTTNESANTLYNLAEAGADATYAYTWGRSGYSSMVQANSIKRSDEILPEGMVHIPTISVGFNDVARNEVRSPIISKQSLKEVCEEAKNLLSNRNTGTWRDNTVMLSTLNEYSEGTYIFPTVGTGFDYLETIREAFTDDTSDHSSIDVRPTQAQIDRVSRMYPSNHSPIRRYLIEQPEMIPVLSFDMKDPQMAALWNRGFGVDELSINDGIIKGLTTKSDYNVSAKLNFDAATGSVVHVRMKSSISGWGQVFFATEKSPNLDEAKSLKFLLQDSGSFHDYYIDLSKNTQWTGTINLLRLDPGEAPAEFEIELIEILGSNDIDVGVDIYVNNVLLSFSFFPKALADGDYEVVGEARKMGFYSLLRLYHEWDRFTDDGVLTLKTIDNKTIVFKVGSDKVTVDGAEKDLGYTFTLRDGLPVFHIKKLCDLIGYEYTDENGKISIEAYNEQEKLNNEVRIPNNWEFDIDMDLDSWSTAGGSAFVSDGFLKFRSTGSDISVRRNVAFEAKDYTHVVVGIKYIPDVMYEGKDSAQLFFTTDSEPSLSERKSVRVRFPDQGTYNEEILELSFDLTQNEFYNGKITCLRIDPFNQKVDFEIDYIRCVKK